MSSPDSHHDTPVSPRCPRCGGAAGARRLRFEARNPFLTKGKKPEQLTCEDCGLDFERPSDGARDSGRSPWSRP